MNGLKKVDGDFLLGSWKGDPKNVTGNFVLCHVLNFTF